MAKESGWVTINGVHVFIDNSGKISKGPAKFIGSSLSDLPSSGKSAADRKAELKAKYGITKSEADEIKSKTAANGKHRSRTASSPVKGPAPGTENSEPTPKTIPEKSEGFIKRTNKTGVTYGDISKVVNTSGTVTMKDVPDLKTLPNGAAKLIVQDNSSQLKQPKFAIQVGDTVMRATPKVAASLFPDEVKNLTSTMGNLASKSGSTGNAAFDKLNAKVAELEALEGKSATAKNIKAAMDRSVDRSMSVGGQTTLKNKFGESVTVSKNRGIYGGAAGFQASIQHSDGSVSLVYASTTSDLSKRINDRNAHYNAPENKAPANTGNPAFDGATTHIIKKIK